MADERCPMCHGWLHNATPQPPPGDKFEEALAHLAAALPGWLGSEVEVTAKALRTAHAQAIEAARKTAHQIDHGKERCPICGAYGLQYCKLPPTPPHPSPSGFRSVGTTEASIANDPDLMGHVEQPAQPQETGGFEEALNSLILELLTGINSTIAEKRDANEQARPKVEAVRAAHQREVEAEHHKTRLEYQHPMDCGHPLGCLLTCTETEPSGCNWCLDKAEWQAKIVKACAAGVAEGRREMAREANRMVYEKHMTTETPLWSIGKFQEWLEARAGEEKKG